MQFSLGKNEKVLKSWVYAYEKRGKEKSEANLTVTNHRLVSIISSPSEVEYSEVSLGSINRIDAVRTKTGGGWLLLIIGLLVIVGGIVSACLVKNMIYVPIIICVLGVALVLAGIISMKNGGGVFYLAFSINGNVSSKLEIGVNSIIKKYKRSQTVKIKIDFAKVDDMISVLGAIINDYKCSREVIPAAPVRQVRPPVTTPEQN